MYWESRRQMAVAWHCIGDKPFREAKMTQFANAYEHIKTSWHRNVFRAICILQGISTAHRWIPLAAGHQHKLEVSFSLIQTNWRINSRVADALWVMILMWRRCNVWYSAWFGKREYRSNTWSQIMPLIYKDRSFYKKKMNFNITNAPLNTHPSEHMHTTKTGCVFVISLCVNHNTYICTIGVD